MSDAQFIGFGETEAEARAHRRAVPTLGVQTPTGDVQWIGEVKALDVDKLYDRLLRSKRKTCNGTIALGATCDLPAPHTGPHSDGTWNDRCTRAAPRATTDGVIAVRCCRRDGHKESCVFYPGAESEFADANSCPAVFTADAPCLFPEHHVGAHCYETGAAFVWGPTSTTV